VRMHSNQMLEMAADSIKLVILRLECEVAQYGPLQATLDRIRDLTDALDLIDPKIIVVDLMEYSE
jgi:hypothetical protein